MPDITRRRCGELLRSLSCLLLREPEGVQARDSLNAPASTSSLSAYEARTYDDGSLRFDKIVRLATVDTVKAGWLVKAKGR